MKPSKIDMVASRLTKGFKMLYFAFGYEEVGEKMHQGLSALGLTAFNTCTT